MKILGLEFGSKAAGAALALAAFGGAAQAADSIVPENDCPRVSAQLAEAGKQVIVPIDDQRHLRQGVMMTSTAAIPADVVLVVYGNPGDPQVEIAKRALYDAHKCGKPADGLVLANPDQGQGYEMFVDGIPIDNVDIDPSGGPQSYDELMRYFDFADYLLTEEHNVAALNPSRN